MRPIFMLPEQVPKNSIGWAAEPLKWGVLQEDGVGQIFKTIPAAHHLTHFYE